MHRIVSLLPSATEIICQLGLLDRLVGVTHECDYPDAVRTLPRVTQTHIPKNATSAEIDSSVREQLTVQTGLYSLDFGLLEQLQPDLIVTQSLCNVCAVAEEEVHALTSRLPTSPRVINLEPNCLDDLFTCLQLVASACQVEVQGEVVIAALRRRIEHVARQVELQARRPRVVVLEWIDPLFCAGHWTPELVRLAGGLEVIGTERSRSRTVQWEDVMEADPEVLVIACCGFDVPRTIQDLPILAAKEGFKNLSCTQSGRIYVVDGNAYFNRPGPRLVDSLEILASALHPETLLPSG